MRKKIFLGLSVLGLSCMTLLACNDAPKTTISADAAYSTYATAEIAYANSGQADPAVAGKLLVADNTLHDALKAVSTAVESGDSSAINLALVTAKSEVANLTQIIAVINNPALSAALTTIQTALDAAATQATVPSVSASTPSTSGI